MSFSALLLLANKAFGPDCYYGAHNRQLNPSGKGYEMLFDDVSVD